MRGLVSVLDATGGSYATATEGCLANDLAATSAVDPGVPADGEAFWYLVRAVNCGGPGPRLAQPRPDAGVRDAGIGLSGGACP